MPHYLRYEASPWGRVRYITSVSMPMIQEAQEELYTRRDDLRRFFVPIIAMTHSWQ